MIVSSPRIGQPLALLTAEPRARGLVVYSPGQRALGLAVEVQKDWQRRADAWNGETGPVHGRVDSSFRI